MKQFLLLIGAALLLTACSSTPTKTFASPEGYAIDLPSDWNTVQGDDAMPDSLTAVAPEANNYKANAKISVSTDFAGEPKREIIAKIKKSLESRKLLEGPTVTEISGEPALTYAWKQRADSTANSLMTVDVTGFGSFVCDDSELYIISFYCLSSQAADFKAKVVDPALASFRTSSYIASQENNSAPASDNAFDNAFDSTPESSAAFDEKPSVKEEAPVKSQAETEVEKAKAQVEAAKAAALEAQEAARKSALEAREAAQAAEAKAKALSEAQDKLDALEGRPVKTQGGTWQDLTPNEPVVVEKVQVETVKVEPVKVEPVKVEPVKVEPAKVETVEVKTVEVEVKTPATQKSSGSPFEMRTVREGR